MTPGHSSPRPDHQSWFGNRVQQFRLPLFVDDRGGLVPLDFEGLPFRPQRAFVVIDAPDGTARGEHALHDQWLLLTCPRGSIEVTVRIETGESQSVVLDSPDRGLLIGPGVWSKQQYLSDSSVLLALASGAYASDIYADQTS